MTGILRCAQNDMLQNVFQQPAPKIGVKSFVFSSDTPQKYFVAWLSMISLLIRVQLTGSYLRATPDSFPDLAEVLVD